MRTETIATRTARKRRARTSRRSRMWEVSLSARLAAALLHISSAVHRLRRHCCQ